MKVIYEIIENITNPKNIKETLIKSGTRFNDFYEIRDKFKDLGLIKDYYSDIIFYCETPDKTFGCYRRRPSKQRLEGKFTLKKIIR